MRLIDVDAIPENEMNYPVWVCLRKQPTIDAVPVVHAKWIRPTKISGRNFDIPHCSACHEVPIGADSNYCPNCGADMRGE